MSEQGKDEQGQEKRPVLLQERMVSHLSQCDEEYGRRVAKGLGVQTCKRSTAETDGTH